MGLDVDGPGVLDISGECDDKESRYEGGAGLSSFSYVEALESIVIRQGCDFEIAEVTEVTVMKGVIGV